FRLLATGRFLLESCDLIDASVALEALSLLLETATLPILPSTVEAFVPADGDEGVGHGSPRIVEHEAAKHESLLELDLRRCRAGLLRHLDRDLRRLKPVGVRVDVEGSGGEIIESEAAIGARARGGIRVREESPLQEARILLVSPATTASPAAPPESSSAAEAAAKSTADAGVERDLRVADRFAVVGEYDTFDRACRA